MEHGDFLMCDIKKQNYTQMRCGTAVGVDIKAIYGEHG